MFYILKKQLGILRGKQKNVNNVSTNYLPFVRKGCAGKSMLGKLIPKPVAWSVRFERQGTNLSKDYKGKEFMYSSLAN